MSVLHPRLYVAVLAKSLAALTILLAACAPLELPPPGWHGCTPAEASRCGEWERCTWGGKCVFAPDPNGPGAADSSHEGSDPAGTPDR